MSPGLHRYPINLDHEGLLIGASQLESEEHAASNQLMKWHA